MHVGPGPVGETFMIAMIGGRSLIRYLCFVSPSSDDL